MGLLGMRERAALLGGDFKIGSVPAAKAPRSLSRFRAATRAPERNMKILLADDHAVVRHGLKQILADEFKKATFGEARNAQEALDLVWKENWDVVVLDITMPGRSGLEVLREIKKSKPKLPVLVLSMHPENQFAVRVLKRGASGYMTKESAPEELVARSKKFWPADATSARRSRKNSPPIFPAIPKNRRRNCFPTASSRSCA